MKSISIALLGLLASAAYASIVCKPSASDCPSKVGIYNPSYCASEGVEAPNNFHCLDPPSNVGLRAHGRYWRQSVQKQDCGGPQRLDNDCNGAGGPCASDSHCCSGLCAGGYCF
ncbi:hypothetical protein BGZ68_006363 [Mortierella alpina]|nr:hypothetical protein BGZ68_006363 [Mortierella alpina]